MRGGCLCLKTAKTRMLLHGYGFPHHSWKLHTLEASLPDETHFGDSVTCIGFCALSRVGTNSVCGFLPAPPRVGRPEESCGSLRIRLMAVQPACALWGGSLLR